MYEAMFYLGDVFTVRILLFSYLLFLTRRFRWFRQEESGQINTFAVVHMEHGFLNDSSV